MSIKFTPMQEKCINLKDCSLLVSAGAGSGKTAVLTQRIMERLTDPNDDFEAEDFIAVTFTKAAAGELKERLCNKISEYVINFPDNKKALRQFAKLQNASVCTIHSFCSDLVSRNFSKLSLSPDMHIGDENENALVARRILDDILENLYNSQDNSESSFSDFADTFAGSKSDEGMTDMILSLYNKLKKNPSIENSLNRAIDKYDEILRNKEYFDSFYGQTARKALLEKLGTAADAMKKLCQKAQLYDETKTAYLPAFEQDLLNISQVAQQVDKGYYFAASALNFVSPTPIKRIYKFEFPEFSKDLREARAAVFQKLHDISLRFFLATKDEIDSASKKTKNLLVCLKNIILTLDTEFTEYKRSRAILDFNDLEKYAFSLLYDINKDGSFTPSLQAREIAQSVKEIYIDEYQDINPIQDMIFRAITKNGKDGEFNRFMVGDKKQSIYRFRGSEPDIFNNYSNSFYDLQSNKKQKRIFLSDNFRCSENIIDIVNFLFQNIMGKDYSSEERLIHSRTESPLNKTIPCELIITKPGEFENQNGKIEKTDRTEAEAYSLALRIKEIVNNPDYLRNDGKMFSYGDIALLLRSMKQTSDVFEKVFKKCGIPVKSERPEQFFNKREISLAVSLLNTIDNPERDIHLATVLKSPIYSFSADELFEIKAGKEQKKLSMYNALVLYAEKGKNNRLKEKAGSAVQELLHFSKLARSLPCDKLVNYVYTKTSLLQICSSKAFGCNTVQKSQSAYNSLLKLYTLARDFSGDSFKGLFSFIDYLGDLASRDVSFEENVSGETEYVKIMSIHHSKGLEFPVCIVANLSKQFNTKDQRQFAVYDDNAGIACKLKDGINGFYSVDTPFRQAVIENSSLAFREEEKRVLYVALTRARDMLILSAGEKNPENLFQNCESSSKKQADADCFLKWILNSIANCNCLADIYSQFSVDTPCNDTSVDKDKLIVKYFERAYSLKYAPNQEITDFSNNQKDLEQDKLYSQMDISQAFERGYNNLYLSKIPAKLTVSKLKTGLLDNDNTENQSFSEKDFENQTSKSHFPDKPKFLTRIQTATAAEKGTAMHLFMQFVSFEDAVKNGCKNQADILEKKGFISAETKALLDFSVLDMFFRSDLYKRISVSPFVKREMRFNLKLPAQDISGISDNNKEFVLVQGVIDCFFENPDGTLTVLDFKTDSLKSENPEYILIERHKHQLLYYCRAASEITGKQVTQALLYSFSLNKEILVDIPN